MSDLLRELDEAEARAAQLRRMVAHASCVEVGHRWQSIGGVNCGCHEYACCSVPIHECSVCGDCDYGDNDEARDVRAKCLVKP